MNAQQQMDLSEFIPEPDGNLRLVKATVIGEAKKRIVFVHIEHDDDCEAPDEMSDHEWKLYSFSHRHGHYRDPETFTTEDEDGKTILDPEIRRKLDEGLAFWLGYFEHGLCNWHLSDERPLGTEGDYRWDGVSRAGLLVWEHDESALGPETYDKRQEDARKFLKRFTQWANGECYGYVVKVYDARFHEEIVFDRPSDYRFDIALFEDSCWGYVGFDDVKEAVTEALRQALKEAT